VKPIVAQPVTKLLAFMKSQCSLSCSHKTPPLVSLFRQPLMSYFAKISFNIILRWFLHVVSFPFRFSDKNSVYIFCLLCILSAPPKSSYLIWSPNIFWYRRLEQCTNLHYSVNFIIILNV
jgi:hypothetical protein